MRRHFWGATALGIGLAVAVPLRCAAQEAARPATTVAAASQGEEAATSQPRPAEPGADRLSMSAPRTPEVIGQEPGRQPPATIEVPLPEIAPLARELLAPAADADQTASISEGARPPLLQLHLPEPPPVAVDLGAQPAAADPSGEAILRALPLPPQEPASFPAIASAPDPMPDAAAMQKAIDAGKAQARLPAKVYQAMAAFYAARDMKPLWLEKDGWTQAARQAETRLGKAEEDGLRNAAYAVPAAPGDDAAARAAAEITLSEAVIRYARDASGARIDPARISALITATPTIPDAAAILGLVSTATDADAALQSFNPPHGGYRALREKLAELRRQEPQPKPVRIPPGRMLRVGMKDPRVPLLRERLSLPAEDSQVYDAALAEAVTNFQRASGLAATGHLNRATTAALSGADENAATEADLIANMEGWRWLPRDLGDRYVIVNVPEFMLRVVDNGTVVHSARVIVGKPDTQTPIFSGTMEYLVVNPYWNVPPSILKKEFLPHMAADPDYAAKHGYQVVRRGNTISIRQPPGERNALGLIKFMFPNRHAVYIHDTPSRSLFANARRAYSHGCVRVQDPFQLAQIVLENDKTWSEKRIRGMVGHGERQIKLAQTLSVHLTYFTAFVDESGKLETRPDLYGHSRKIEAALGLL